MYIRQLSLYGFKCFGKTVIDLRHPGEDSAEPTLDNFNLIVGDNGGGKSSVLRGAAIAMLSPILLDSGFVAYRLVRRPDGDDSLVKAIGVASFTDGNETAGQSRIEMLARIERRGKSNTDRLHRESTPGSPIDERIFDDHSPAYFVVGYGATRRSETGDFSPSASRRSRGMRYQRVASLFEDQVPLAPLQSWLSRTKRRDEATALINNLLPNNCRLLDTTDEEDGEPLFAFDHRQTPLQSLSDGYKAFVSWASDLVMHMVDVCPPELPLADMSGVVLIDEIDLHLHPSWQREVVQTLSRALPRMQFIATTHSPLVASSVHRENIFVTDVDDDGWAMVKQIGERVYGRSVEQLLLSSYFGLESTKPASFMDASHELFADAASGDAGAALAFLEQMAKPPKDTEELTERFAAAKRQAERKALSD